MEKKYVTERKKRAQVLFGVLKKLFPVQKTMLVYHNPYELLIAVILSAQCTDAQVNKVTPVLFRHYPDPRSLAQAPVNDIERIIFSTGFYKSKSRRISDCAKILVNKYNSMVPCTLSELIQLPGVGRKTANVVLGNAFNIQEGIAVDTHVRRFALKFELTDSRDPNSIESDLKQLFPKKYWTDIAYYMIAYGREICPARKHDCTDHPCTKKYPRAASIWPTSK